jgi:hypothetical protein
MLLDLREYEKNHTINWKKVVQIEFRIKKIITFAALVIEKRIVEY